MSKITICDSCEFHGGGAGRLEYASLSANAIQVHMEYKDLCHTCLQNILTFIQLGCPKP